MTKLTDDAIKSLAENMIGTEITDFYYEEDDDYFVIVLDGGDVSVRFMSDLI